MGCILNPIVIALLVSVAVDPAAAMDDLSRKTTAGPDERLESIRRDYSDARARFQREFRTAKGDDEIESILGRYLAAIDRAAAEGMKLARDHPGQSVGIDALRFVVTAEQAGQLRDPRPTPLSDEALRILRRDHVHAPGMGEFCEAILLEPHDPTRESLIRAVLDGHPGRDDRGHACFALAELRRYQAQEIRVLRGKPELLRPIAAIRGRELMARFLGQDPEAFDVEADALLKRVIAEFGEIPLPDGSRYRTLADRAEAELLGRHGLAVGKPAPEIEGRDPEGKPFRLSDYRGKVVLLTFSGNWCGPCRRMYPEERRLVEHFRNRSFALLSVNTDDEVATLRASIEAGEITWRCWWDGRIGPISDRWGILVFPSLFLIDGDGVIRARPGQQSITLENEIESLLAKTPAKPSP